MSSPNQSTLHRGDRGDDTSTSRGEDRVPRWVVGTAIAMAVTLAVLTILRHRFFLSGAFDLGFYLDSTWHIAHGQTSNSMSGYNVLSDHFSPVLFLLSAAWLTPWPAPLLLIVQAFAVGAGVVPAYLLGRKIAGPNAATLAVVWYALSATIWYATFFDIHMHMLGLPILLWMMWRVEARPTVLALALGEVALICMREDVALLGAIVVLIGFVRTRHRPLLVIGLLGALVPVLYVLFGKYVFGPIDGYIFVVRYKSYGTTPTQILTGIVTHPQLVLERLFGSDAMGVYLGVFLPMLFLCFIGWRVAWPGIAVVAFNLIADDWHPRVLTFQYQIPAVPFLMWGALTGYQKLVTERGVDGRLLMRASVAVSVIAFVILGPLVAFGEVPRDRHIADIVGGSDRTKFDDVVAHAPPDGELSASFILVPHVAGREHVYNFPLPLTCSTEPIGLKKFEPEYILLAVTQGETERPELEFIPRPKYVLEWSGPNGELWHRQGPAAPIQDCPSPLEKQAGP